jgi:membrane protein YqaA with SNARE-associated domain
MLSPARAMNLEKLPSWLQPLVANFGGAGVFVVAFLDSSVLSFPVINDLLVITLSIRHPAAMPYYALMATLGSLAGCLWLYWMARKGGELMYRRRAGARAQRIRDWIQRNAFLSVAVPSMLPPPTPFKLFVIGAGVFQVRLGTFVLALLAGRGFRYFAEGLLAVRYGEQATRFLAENKLPFSLGLLAFVLLVFLLIRLLARGREAPGPPPAGA